MRGVSSLRFGIRTTSTCLLEHRAFVSQPKQKASKQKYQTVHCMHYIVSGILTVLAFWSWFSNCRVCSLGTRLVYKWSEQKDPPWLSKDSLHVWQGSAKWTNFGLDWSLVPDVSGNPVMFCEPAPVPGQHCCFCLGATIWCFTGAHDMFCWW